MDINDLKIFMTVLEYSTMKEAAHVTNNSVSRVFRAINRLESELGVELFIHRGNHILLNDYGRALKEHAPTILDEVTKMNASLEAIRFRGTELKVQSCDPGPAWFMCHELAQKLSKELITNVYTDFNVALYMLKQDTIDFLIVSEPINERGLVCQFMAQDRLLLSVDKDDERFLDTKQISLQDGRIDSLHYYNLDGAFSNQLQKIYDRIPKSTRLVCEEDFWKYKAQFKRKGMITTNTKLVVNYREDSVERRLIPVSDKDATINYYLVYKVANKKTFKDILELAQEWTGKYPK